ncbi:MAG: hypothetical protein J6S67_20905 [Methanobrevibacter sp.]|nr:hypothetical protein [Methanobrevibacter sp.]
MNDKLLFEMINCVGRECAMRKNVYPKWIIQGRLTKEKAEREQYLMEQVKGLLQAIYNKNAPPEVIQQTLQYGEG